MKSGVNGDTNPHTDNHTSHSKTSLPFDPTLAVRPLFPIISPFNLAYLMRDDSEFINLDLYYFDEQIMQVIVPRDGNGTNYTYVHVNRSNN